MKRQDIKDQRIPKEKRMEISSGFRVIAKQIQKIKEQHKRLGLFCHDRELLSCSCCGLEEDVTCEGFLIVANPENPGVDTGLRFSVVDEEKGLYQCSGCGSEIVVPD